MEVDLRENESFKNNPKPLTLTDIRSFLGLAGYYRRFVKGFSSIAAPLTALMKKIIKYEWAETCEKSSQDLEDRLTSAPVLTFPKYAVEALLESSAYGCVHRPQESLVCVHAEGVESTSGKMVGDVEGL
ncbi:uncharacterized protein LOC107024961 [Solanum pennellii]|uniref:Uncharacterized protein LOC107024961 n=1 Tax=Solanum pennellii TaxID=28526 RepID=A0ABM1H784_SOLPN|nr:uncharacterized protein LOC107024961 [Solanum pennellii]